MVWLVGKPQAILYKPLGCVSAFWKWMPAGKDIFYALQRLLALIDSVSSHLSVALMSALILPGCLSPSLTVLLREAL